MANFALSITNPTTGTYDITTSNNVITVVDWSNYDTNTQAGHTQADFSYFYKIKFTNPDGTEYLFSSIGDGDASLTVPASCTLPISTAYTYTTGDGIYRVCLYVVPTWNKADNHFIGDHVVYKDVIYICLHDNVTSQPNTTINDWTPVTDIDLLPARYRLCTYFAVTCDIHACFVMANAAAFCSINGMGCSDNICDNAEFLKAAELDMIMENVEILVNQNDWDGAAVVINKGRSLCCCSND